MLSAISNTVKTLFALLLLTLSSSLFAQEKTTIDLLIVHTKGVSDAYGGNPSTRINHLIQTTNQIYEDSGVNLELRVAHIEEVNYSETRNSYDALKDITFAQNAAFSNIESLRAEHKADMVVFYRPYSNNHGSCGVAWIPGVGTNGDFSASYIKDYQYSHVAINTCGDYVTAHELGHNLGLRHSRRQDGTGGTTNYALGHGVDGSFTTIMAYQSAYNVNYWTGKVYKFSNPEVDCKGLPCGVNRSASNGADARHALNMTGPQVAKLFKKEEKEEQKQQKTELDDLYAQVQAALAAYELATADYEKSAALYKQLKATRKAAKKALREAKKAAKKAARSYKKAVKKYERFVKKAARFETKMQDAYAKYENETKEKRKQRHHKKYLRFKEKYDTATASAAEYLAEAEQLAPIADSTAEALDQATTAVDKAKSEEVAEKELKKVLKKEMRDSKKTYKKLEREYKKAVRKAEREAKKRARSGRADSGSEPEVSSEPNISEPEISLEPSISETPS